MNVKKNELNRDYKAICALKSPMRNFRKKIIDLKSRNYLKTRTQFLSKKMTKPINFSRMKDYGKLSIKSKNCRKSIRITITCHINFSGSSVGVLMVYSSNVCIYHRQQQKLQCRYIQQGAAG